jgi:hypothetical protein
VKKNNVTIVLKCLKGSTDGFLHLGLLGFWTYSSSVIPKRTVLELGLFSSPCEDVSE